MTAVLANLKSVAELTLLTYVTGFLGLVTASGFDLTDMGALRGALVAALPAALAAVYGVAVRRLGDVKSALALSPGDTDK